MAPQLQLVDDTFQPPNEEVLKGVMTYRGIHVLYTVQKNAKKATHYACCMIYGRNPLWIVWNVHGKFIRFAGSREQIEQAYPTHRWARKSATWSLVRVPERDEDADVRRRRVLDSYKRGA